ncbi:MAG: aryl-sulfate sulfotransferase [Chitinispirillaceae bacterium]|nr:aryl-sulfate sulfotransferase [Chitinispirillaceae bacterium]
MKKNLFSGGVASAALLFAMLVSKASALSEGYILAGAYGGSTTILMDTAGTAVHTWDHSGLTNRLNGYSCYLLPNGNLLRTSQTNSTRVPPNANPKQGAIDEVDKSGKLVWTYTLANDSMMLHHDMKALAGGNILAISFYSISKTRAQEIGIDPALMTIGTNFLLGEKIIEIKPRSPSGGDIVWEWCIFDHIAKQEEAAAHPELISGHIVSSLWQGQWVHLNGLDYCEANKLIVFSSRIFSELYVIERTETAELARGHTGGTYGKGGDILYRWGKPGNYGGSGATTIDCLHSTTWVPEGCPGAGNIMFFHNNIAAIRSQVIEVKPPVDAEGKFIHESGKPFEPETPTWLYAPTSDFYSRFMSSAIHMPNGNIVAHETFPTKTQPAEGTIPQTDSRIREVDPDGKVVWMDTLTLKGSMGFNPAKIMYYPSSYEGVRKLLGLTPVHDANSKTPAGSLSSHPSIHQTAGSIVFTGVRGHTVTLVTLQGKIMLSADSGKDVLSLPTGSMSTGIYGAKVMKGNRCIFYRMIGIVN